MRDIRFISQLGRDRLRELFDDKFDLMAVVLGHQIVYPLTSQDVCVQPAGIASNPGVDLDAFGHDSDST